MSRNVLARLHKIKSKGTRKELNIYSVNGKRNNYIVKKFTHLNVTTLTDS
jgi:hypothetical protein